MLTCLLFCLGCVRRSPQTQRSQTKNSTFRLSQSVSHKLAWLLQICLSRQEPQLVVALVSLCQVGWSKRRFLNKPGRLIAGCGQVNWCARSSPWTHGCRLSSMDGQLSALLAVGCAQDVDLRHMLCVAGGLVLTLLLIFGRFSRL